MRHVGGRMGNHGPNCRSAVGSASMVSTRLRRRTTRHAPLLCSVLVMGGAEASGCTDWCSRWTPSRVGGHWPGIVPGLLVPLALLSNASGWKHPSRAAALNHESCDGGSSTRQRRLAGGCDSSWVCEESACAPCSCWLDFCSGYNGDGCDTGCRGCGADEYIIGPHACTKDTITSRTYRPCPSPPPPY